MTTFRFEPIAFIALLAAVTFAWHAWSGVRKGVVRLPIQILGADEYDREHTLYWGIVALNVIASAGFLTLAVLLISRDL